MAFEEEYHVAHPRLYGAPAYARPPLQVATRTAVPINPDDLPIAAYQTEEERRVAEELQARPFGLAPATSAGDEASPSEPAGFVARAGRLLRRAS
jgi:hypothetical protein